MIDLQETSVKIKNLKISKVYLRKPDKIWCVDVTYEIGKYEVLDRMSNKSKKRLLRNLHKNMLRNILVNN